MPRVSVMPAGTVDCWSCEAPNSPGRMFCVSCGSFIAIGSKARPTPGSQPFSGPPPVPGDADVDVSLPFVEGVPPLGSYALEAQRRATRRTRTLTAVASVVLATVIGGAALYLASPLGQRNGHAPQVAATVPSSAPRATAQTRAVSGVTVHPEAVVADPLDAAPDILVEPGTEAAPVVETEAVSEPEPEAVDRPEAALEPDPISVVEPDPVSVVEPESVPVMKPESVEPTAPADPVDDAVDTTRAIEVDRAATVETPPYDGGWVCGEPIAIEDIGDRDWSISHVAFRVRSDFERVVLHLDKVGAGSGDTTTISADSVRSYKVRTSVPGARAPGLGRRSVTLQLEGGFSGMRGLNSYRPSGVGVIKEFSLYPVGSDGRSVVISADTDGCYRVRVPGWNDPSGSLRRAEIHVDIKP